MQIGLYILATIGGLTILYAIFRLKLFLNLAIIETQKLDISFQELIFMYLRRVDVGRVLKLLILCKK